MATGTPNVAAGDVADDLVVCEPSELVSLVMQKPDDSAQQAVAKSVDLVAGQLYFTIFARICPFGRFEVVCTPGVAMRQDHTLFNATWFALWFRSSYLTRPHIFIPQYPAPVSSTSL